MFCLTSAMQYYLYSYPTDMRRSFYTLSGMVTNLMGRNVQDGDVYIFVNRLDNPDHADPRPPVRN
jgi:transposase